MATEAEVHTRKSAGSDPAFFSCWDIHAYYGESYIVQGVSFDIREGEIVALLGRNGAGKTSTLRTIAQVGSPELRHGEISYENSRQGLRQRFMVSEHL